MSAFDPERTDIIPGLRLHDTPQQPLPLPEAPRPVSHRRRRAGDLSTLQLIAVIATPLAVVGAAVGWVLGTPSEPKPAAAPPTGAVEPATATATATKAAPRRAARVPERRTSRPRPRRTKAPALVPPTSRTPTPSATSTSPSPRPSRTTPTASPTRTSPSPSPSGSGIPSTTPTLKNPHGR